MCIEIHTLRVRDNDTAPFLERMNPNAHLKVQDTRKCRGISKFDPTFASLTRYNSKFASLSKYNPGAHELFDSGVSHHFQ
jgi:hypothetical protein